MKSASAVYFLVLISVFSISVFAQTPSTQQATGTSTVSGRILVKGEPAPGVAVTLIHLRSMGMMGTDAPPRARADDSGVFRFTAVPSGQYQLRAVAPGFVSEEFSPLGGGASKQIIVGDNENIENLELALKPGGVVTGLVVDSNGNPAVEEFIQLTKLDSAGKPVQSPFRGGNLEMYMTDDRGIYRIYGVEEGQYLVSAGRPQLPGVGAFAGPTRSAYPQTFHPDTQNAAEATKVAVTAGFVAENVDIRFREPRKTYAILGRLVNAETGQPLVGVEISYSQIFKDRPGYSFQPGGGASSGVNGEFRLTGIDPGQYNVFAIPQGQSDFYGEPTPCAVVDSDVQGIEVRVRQGGSVSGVIVLEGTRDPVAIAGLKQLSVMSYYNSPQPQRFRNEPTKINPDGSFKVAGLPPGKVMLTIMGTPTAPGLILRRTEQNGVPVRDGVNVQSGEAVSGVRLIMVYGTITLRGSVQVTGGSLPPGAILSITAMPADQTPGQALVRGQVDPRGQFVLENMPAGEYELRVYCRLGAPGERLNQELMSVLNRIRQRVTVAGQNPSPVTFVIDLAR